jgi:hypothetical protein
MVQKQTSQHKPSLPPGGRGTAAGFLETRLRVFGVRAKVVEGERATSDFLQFVSSDISDNHYAFFRKTQEPSRFSAHSPRFKSANFAADLSISSISDKETILASSSV